MSDKLKKWLFEACAQSAEVPRLLREIRDQLDAIRKLLEKRSQQGPYR